MNKRVRRFLLQVFSSLNALFLTFQPLAALPVLLANPVVVQAEASVSADAVDLTFDAGSHEFKLRVKTDQALPYVLTYLDEKQDPQVEQAAQGYLEKMEEGVFGADVYAGTCSGDDCTPITFIRGTLAVGDSFKNSFQLVNGAIVFDGPKPAEDQICVNPDEVGLTAGETLWSVDETTGVAETKTKVQPGVSYQFPLDDSVSVTFSCLPKDENLRSPLKIQQVLISELNLPNSVKTDATYAYDITTEMENGTFEYDLTLPKMEGVEAEVVYIEKSLEEVKTSVLVDDVITVEETEDVKVEQELDSDEIKLSGIEHFSIYLTTYTNYTVGSSGVTNPDNAWTSNDQYAVFDTDGDWAEYRFDNLPILSAGDTIDGIKITFEGNTTVTAAYFDVAVYNKSSNSYSSTKVTSLFGATPPDSTTSAGGSTEKWGKSWTSNDFNGDNFKIKITKRSSGTINLDRVWVEIAYTPAPICTNDQQGANDEPGQKDLTQMCHQSSNLPQKLEVEWNWDESGWSGNNTGDACSLYDTNSNGNANYAICVTVGGNPASLSNQRLFSCDDGSNNKCSGPTNITPGAFGPCLASVENSDPFPSGDAYPNDTHAWCNIWLSQYGLPATLQLIDVCSYPSQQPNSDPSDCILASTGNSPTATPTPTTTTTPTPTATPSPTPTSSPTPTNTPSPTPTNTPTPTATPTPNPGTITIIKDTQPDSSQDFVFSFSGVGQTATEFSLDDDSDPTLSNTYEITDLPTNIYDISEQGVSGWTNTSVICQSNMPWDPQDSPDGVGYQGSVSISLVAGENVTCTFTNLRDTGSITVNKLIDTDGDRVFESGNTRANELGFTWSVNNGAPNSMGSTALNIPTTLGEDKYYVEESSVTGYRTVGWYLSDGSCDNLDGTTVPAEVTVAKDGVTAITFCNAVDAFCGDGMVNQDNEQCDYGSLNGQSSCSSECTWVNECRQEMVANGGFETPVVSQGAGWDAFDNPQMAGWSAAWYGGSASYNGHTRPEPKTELHRGVSGWLPASGSQYVELDTDWTGPVNGFNGEPASIALSQNIPTIPGYQYTLSWKHSPRPNHNNNHLQVVVGDTEVFNSGNLAGGSNTNWQTQSYSFVATTDLTTISFIEIGITDSFGMFLDDVKVECNGLAPVEVFAQKVICDAEQYLPNWGDDAGGQVTATTAQDYVDQSNGRCRLASDWNFEWGYDGAAPKQSGEYVGYAGAPWTEFNVKTFEASPAAAIIPNPDNKTLWFREVLQEGYIPFTYPPDSSPGSNVSAEFYCNNDHYKYDNYESISNAKPGDTYYCVAFNAPTAKDVEICKVDNQDKAQSGWTVGLAKQTPEFSEVIPVTSGAGVDAALPAGEHVVFASGTYRYGSSAMIADAGFSYRPLSIPMGADGWVSGDQLTTVGGLELKVGGQNIAWGGYNPTHQYTTLVSGFAGGNLNLNIWDNQYSDNLNNGNFRAQVHQVITTGVTEDDGCVTLEDVPYGDYVAFELPQDNWSHVSTMVNGQNVDAFPAPITVSGRDSSVTFENRLVTGQIRVQKTTDPAGDPTAFNVTAAGGGQVFGSATGSVTDTTDYTYTVEPQTYSVSEDVPNGWELTSNNCSNLLVPSDGQRVCQISNTKLYDIHGYKWNDVNRNAIDDQEARLPGWEIFIDQNDNQQWDDGEPKTTTSSDPDHLGWYWFENLYAGTYDVCEILQDGWAQTYPVDPMCHTVALPDLNPRGMAVSENAVVGPEYNFGNTQYGDASVYKYEDLNTNGKYDAGEPLLPDWEMVLGSSDNGELRQTTDTSGNTVFDVLGGTYYLSEEMQEGWYQSAISCDSNLGGVMITQPNYAYGHHGMCSGWNTCGDAATCALKACEANGYSTLVSYGDQRPCTEFDNCSLFYNINEDLSYQADWGNWCGMMGVTDIVCSNSSRLIRPVVNKPVVVNPGETSTCYVGNYQPGTIEGTKYFDADQNGRFDDGESVMQYWGISLTGPDVDQQVVTDENGAFSFTNLKAGTYTLCEEDRTEWGWQVTEPAEPINKVCREVIIDRSGETEEANFGNFIESRLYILKTNDAWPTDVTIGDEVTYTIRVMAVGGPVYDATVLDVPPAQLSYVPDSYTAESSNGTDLRADGTTGDPNYQSPGKWTLGDLDKDEIVTLTYKAKVGTLADPGVYPDMVWATGTSEQSRATEGETDDLLALSDPDFSSNSGGVDFDGSQGHFGEDNFAGTQVAVVLDQTPFSEYQVGKTEEKQGDVLGASTELPATGARTWLTLLALISIVAGAGFLIMGKRSRNSGLKTLVGLFVVGFSLWFAQPAQALTSVRVEEPYNNSAEFTLDAITNQTTMKIDFVVLNTDNISVTAQCQQQRNDGAWSNITTNYTVKAGGNSGYCEAKDLEHDQNYDFRVVVSGDGPDKISDEVRVGLDTNRPDKPVNYSKNPGNYCEDKIGFKTANDGQTSSVEVYRSTDNDHFTAKPDTRVITIPIGPNQEYTLTTSKPNCDDTYYYVIRAFDVNGNASDLVGDLEIKTVIIESASGTTQTVQLGAIPAGSAFIAGGSTTDETAEGTTGEGEEEAGEPETTAEPTETESTEGTVLGSATETFMSFLTRFGLPIGVGLIVLAGLYVIFFGKRNEK